MYMVYNLTLIGHMAINVDWEIFAVKCFRRCAKQWKLNAPKYYNAYMHYIREPLSGKIFLMWKFQTQNYIYRKSFLIYSRVISNKHYHEKYPQNWWGQTSTVFSLRLLQNHLQMPTKWTPKACMETLHECNFKKYEDLHNLGSQIVILSNHQLTPHSAYWSSYFIYCVTIPYSGNFRGRKLLRIAHLYPHQRTPRPQISHRKLLQIAKFANVFFPWKFPSLQ